MKLENYIIKHDEEKVAVIAEKKDFENFPLEDANIYISKERISKKVIFIMTPDKKNRANIVEMDVEVIEMLIKNKSFTLALVDGEGKIVEGFEFDVKIIK